MKSRANKYLLLAFFVIGSSVQTIGGSLLGSHRYHETRPMFVPGVQPSANSFSRSLVTTQEVTPADTEIGRTFFLSIGGGFLEFIGVGFGAQIGSDVSLALKSSMVFVSGNGLLGPPTATGVGVRLIMALPDLVLLQRLIHFNALRIECSYLFRVDHEQAKNKGIAAEVTAGYEDFKSRGASVFWSCGVAVSTAEGIEPLVFPSVKIGMNWNL